MRVGPRPRFDTEPDPRRRRVRAVERADRFLREREARVRTVRVDRQLDRGQIARRRSAGGPRRLSMLGGPQ